MLTRSALESELRPYRGRVYRIVEAQHRISTNRLADSNADQALLEVLAEYHLRLVAIEGVTVRYEVVLVGKDGK